MAARSERERWILDYIAAHSSITARDDFAAGCFAMQFGPGDDMEDWRRVLSHDLVEMWSFGTLNRARVQAGGGWRYVYTDGRIATRHP